MFKKKKSREHSKQILEDNPITKDQFQLQKQEIINLYGQPEYDNHEPVNESAKRISALNTQWRIQALQESRLKAKAAGQKVKPQGVQEIYDSVSKRELRALQGIKLPDLQIDERYLTAFTEQERGVIYDHFNTELSDSKLGIKHNMSRQKVTALLNDTRTKVLESRLFDSIGPWRTRLALLKLVEAGNQTVALRLGEHFSVIKNESKDINLNTKPLEDSKAEAMLKELGDKLIDEIK